MGNTRTGYSLVSLELAKMGYQAAELDFMRMNYSAASLKLAQTGYQAVDLDVARMGYSAAGCCDYWIPGE